MLQYLLEVETADPRIRADNGYLPIHYAACKGSEEAIKCLMSYAPDSINAHTKNLLTPIAVACQVGNFDTVQFLLSRGARTKLTDRNGLSPLHWGSFIFDPLAISRFSFSSACFAGHLNIVKLLVCLSRGGKEEEIRSIFFRRSRRAMDTSMIWIK